MVRVFIFCIFLFITLISIILKILNYDILDRKQRYKLQSNWWTWEIDGKQRLIKTRRRFDNNSLLKHNHR